MSALTGVVQLDRGSAPLLVARHRGVRHVEDGLVVIADARIDGGELRANAGAEIAEAYRRWGSDCARHLLGDFAFIVWDERTRTIYAARDQLGMRSLYYLEHEGVLGIASEPHALFGRSGAQMRPDALAIALFLIEEYLEDDQTLYEGVRALPAGHQLVVEHGQRRVECYWSAPIWRRAPERSDRDHAEEFAAVFREAVACRLVTSGRVGIELSGGLDSSSVASQVGELARERSLANEPLFLHLVFPGMDCDETRYSDAVARRWNVPVMNVSLGDADAEPQAYAEHPDLIYHPTMACYEPLLSAARAEGVDVVLSGIGGDHLMDETRVEPAEALRALELRDALEMTGVSGASGSWRNCRRLWDFGIKQLLPEPLRRGLRRWRPRRRPGLLSQRAATAALGQVYGRMRRDERAPQPSLVTRQLVRLLRSHYTTVPIAQSDRLGVRHGIEYRHPFLDLRLVELMLAMPPHVRLRRGVTKRKPLLRRAMGTRLPPDVLDRTDAGVFSCYLEAVLLRRHGRRVAKLFEASRLADLGIVDETKVRALFSENMGSDRSEDRNESLKFLALATGMELWLRNSFS